jgi:hypothetical protein
MMQLSHLVFEESDSDCSATGMCTDDSADLTNQNLA